MHRKIRDSIYRYLSYQFLGKIGFNIRAIQIVYKEKEIAILCYFDEKITDEQREEISQIETELICSLVWKELNIYCDCIVLDSQIPMYIDDSTEMFYLRKEN